MSHPPLERSNPDPLTLLRSVFGYDDFRTPQAEVINHVMAGGDALVLMPTGGGKSLCYQIPARALSGVTLVISPLIALMEDQVLQADQIGIKAAYLNSTQSAAERAVVEARLASGELELLYLAPERLQMAETLSMIKDSNVALIAIDEAHCVSVWGHNFRPDYLSLSVLKESFPDVPLLALTATANDMTRQEILQRLLIPRAKVFIKGFDRPNIFYQIQQKKDPKKQLMKFLHGREHQAGIVYCLSRKKTEQTAAWLQDKGFTALAYHAGMSPEERLANQRRFLREDGVIMVATIAFGMGIDKPDVRFVAHMDLPKSIEAYYQETGRAGRDGEAADAWMVYGLQDVVLLQQMVQQNDSEQQTRIEQNKLNSMLAFCEMSECRRRVVLNYFGEDAPEKCGHCDNCVTPKPQFDATIPVQKLLSAIYRTGQRFGAKYVIDVLLGRADQRMTDFGHDTLSVFGIGTDLNENQWRSIVRQLVVRNIIDVDVQGYGGLRLNPGSRAILKGDEQVFLNEDLGESATTIRSRKQLDPTEDIPYDERLYESLKTLRGEIARASKIAPFMVFHDRTLKELAAIQPETGQSLLTINGIGAQKAERYGPQIFEVIAQHNLTGTH